MDFADLKLARRLEEAEACDSQEFAEALQRLRPDSDIAVETIAGGRVVFAGMKSPMSEARGLGLQGEVRAEDLDRLDAFYFGRGATSKVGVCPMADPSLLKGLTRRGYEPFEFENVLYRTMGPDSEFGDPLVVPGLEIRQATADEMHTYRDAVFSNFFGAEAASPEVVDLTAALFHMPQAILLLARLEGQAVGGGAVLIHDGVAFLAGAAILPAYRNRGVHRALSRTRLALAADRGCDLFAQAALPGSGSQRNAERNGFRVAYTKLMMARTPPSSRES